MIVYKVGRKIYKQPNSFYSHMSWKWSQKYTLNEPTYPEFGCLYAFKDYESALAFASDKGDYDSAVIYKCEATPSRSKYCGFIFDLWNIDAPQFTLKKLPFFCSFINKWSVPEGTVFCAKITPIKKLGC